MQSTFSMEKAIYGLYEKKKVRDKAIYEVLCAKVKMNHNAQRERERWHHFGLKWRLAD